MNKSPLFLLCNDDGVHAPGIQVLASKLRTIGDVIVVAPHVEKSASSHAITISMPLRMEKLNDDVYAVEGTPADCVMFALQKLLVNRKPDWVISGINRGSNLGHDVLYSGTVGAAMEGALHGIPSIAISSHNKGQKYYLYETAADVLLKILNDRNLFPPLKGVLNINVPNVEYTELQGFKVATLGKRIYEEQFRKSTDPRGRDYYWVGGGGHLFEEIPGSDCDYIDKNFVTLSFLRPSFFFDEDNKILQNNFKNLKI